MEIDSDNLIVGLASAVGSALLGYIIALWRKVSGLETRAALLEQADEHHERQRLEEREIQSAARKSIAEKIDLHHTVMIDKIDTVDARVDRVEKLIRNGH